MLKIKMNLNNAWQIIKKGNAFMLISLTMLSMAMLVSTNYANNQSLERNDLNKQINIIEDNFRLLNINVSELQTTERIEQESQKLNLVKIQTQDVYYLAANRDLVALK